MSADKPTFSFADRYANDSEFRKQVDEGRKRANSKRELVELKEALKMVRGERTARRKLY